MENGKARDANRTEFSRSGPRHYGGEEGRSVIEFRAGPEHNGNVYECFGRNPTVRDRREMAAKINLVVLCKCTVLSAAAGVALRCGHELEQDRHDPLSKIKRCGGGSHAAAREENQ